MTDAPPPKPPKPPISPVFAVVAALTVAVGGSKLLDLWNNPPPAPRPAPPAAAPEVSIVRPPNVRTSDPAIRSLRDSTNQLGVTLHYEDTGDELMILEVSGAIENIGKAMQAGAPEGRTAKSVVVFVDTAGVDRLGNTGTLHVMELVFAADDLRNAKFDNLSSDSVLALATKLDIDTRAGAEILIGYCRAATKSNRGVVTRFCAKIADRLASS